MTGRPLGRFECARASLAVVLAAVVLVGCGGDGGAAASATGACTLASAADVPASGRLVFRSGFEVPSLIGLKPQDAAGRTFVDEDSGYVWGVPWVDESGGTYVTHTQTAGWGEDPYQIVELIPDPENAGNLVLHTANASDTVPARSFQARVALRLFPDDASLATRQFYARYRMRLDPALAGVRDAESPSSTTSGATRAPVASCSRSRWAARGPWSSTSTRPVPGRFPRGSRPRSPPPPPARRSTPGR